MRALLFVGTLVCLLPALSWADTLWTGPMVSFSKANFANPALAENQDRLTAEVWITRGDQFGLFNAALETVYQTGSPVGTRWATGRIADGVATLTFSPWVTAVGNSPASKINVPMVMHLTAEDIYVDVMLTAWQSGRDGFGGGGFSYVRSTSAPVVTVSVPAWPPSAALLAAALLATAAHSIRRQVRRTL